MGNQAFTNTVSYANGARLKWSLTGNAVSSLASGSLSAPTVNVTSGAALDLFLNGAGSAVNFTNIFWKQSHVWTVVTATTQQSGTFTLGTISADPGGRAASSYGTFSLAQSSAGTTINWKPRSLAVFQYNNFGANATDESVAGYVANPDNDGVINLFEAFYGTDPNVSAASPLQTLITGNRLGLQFPRNSDLTDVVVRIQGADTPAGPWTDLAQSTGGAAFTTLVGSAAVSETGGGAIKTVLFADQYLTSDSAHPRRFLRLWIQAQ